MGFSDSSIAKARWELENEVQGDDKDAVFRYNGDEQTKIIRNKPWQADPQYFKHVRMSSLALLKIIVHARSGGNLEVMGMLQGKIESDTFIVLDSFALPVEGTETRVNAQAEANEYMVDFISTNKAVHRNENVVGWYHSHPGYGCWLSGIDCSTQLTNQRYTEPFLAIVVDPVRSMASGKVEIGAFRTYPENYKRPDESPSEYQTIPLSKVEDFGVHANEYYSLSMSFFKSSADTYLFDLLWNRYWVDTLSASPLIRNREFVDGQMTDFVYKLYLTDVANAPQKAGQKSPRLKRLPASQPWYAPGSKESDENLNKVCCDISKFAAEQAKGISSQIVKDLLFNFLSPRLHGAQSGCAHCRPPAAAVEDAAPSVDKGLSGMEI